MQSYTCADPKAYKFFLYLIMRCILLTFVLAKDMHEQYKAIQAHHFIRIIKAHMEKIMPSTFM